MQVSLILEVAELFTGDLRKLYTMDGYRQLFERHQKFHAEMERVRTRRDIGVVASFVPRFDKTLPKPAPEARDIDADPTE